MTLLTARNTGLTDLSSELILEICEYLCIHCVDEDLSALDLRAHKPWNSRQALVNLSCVSRRIGAIAQSVLFHQFGFSGEPTICVFKFCRTLSGNANLARKVHMLQLGAEIPSLPHESISPQQTSWARRIIERYRDHINWDMFGDPPNGDLASSNSFLRQVVPILVLLQTPRVEQLWIQGKGPWYLFNYMRNRQEPENNHLLQNLRTLKIYMDPRPPLRPPQILPTFLELSHEHLGGFLENCPQLEHLTLQSLGGIVVPPRLHFENLRVLEIRHTAMSKESLRILIQAAKQLEEFTYSELDGLRVFGVDENDYAAIKTNEVFSLLASRNRHFRKVMLESHWRWEPLNTPCPLSSVEYLEINSHAFCDMSLHIHRRTKPDSDLLVRVFPPNLERLVIHIGLGGLKYILDPLVRFTAGQDGSPPDPAALNLRSITLNACSSDGRLPQGELPIDSRAAARFIRSFGERCHAWISEGRHIFIYTKDGEFGR
ncbi:hypothetical protein G7046_g3086 [Stylonectria norvegica]|nr:hypothetical protein G7046_g3086 [Stylonectria norvegica]